METTIMGYIVCILGYIGIMENKMETTIRAYCTNVLSATQS